MGDFRDFFTDLARGAAEDAISNGVGLGRGTIRNAERGNIEGVVRGGVWDYQRNQRVEQRDLTRLEREQNNYDKALDRYDRDTARYPDRQERIDANLARAQDRYLNAYDRYVSAHGEPPDYIMRPEEMTVPGAQNNRQNNQQAGPQAGQQQSTYQPAAPVAQLGQQDMMVLQAGLRMLDIDAGPVDGLAGANTQDGINAYVRQHPELGLSADDPQGVLAAVRQDLQNSPDIQAKMGAIVADGGGADPQDVRAVQVILNDQSQASLDVDGKMGGLTAQAYASHMSNSYASSADIMVADLGGGRTPVSPAAEPVEQPGGTDSGYRPPSGPTFSA